MIERERLFKNYLMTKNWTADSYLIPISIDDKDKECRIFIEFFTKSNSSFYKLEPKFKTIPIYLTSKNTYTILENEWNQFHDKYETYLLGVILNNFNDLIDYRFTFRDKKIRTRSIYFYNKNIKDFIKTNDYYGKD